MRGELPPRLTAQVLTDAEGATAWERHVVETLAGARIDGTPEHALAEVRANARTLASWQPSSGVSLVAAVSALAPIPAPDRDDTARQLAAPASWRGWFDIAASTCRDPWLAVDPLATLAELDARYVAPVWERHAGPVRRYLAARAFGSWISYQADAAVSLAAWLTLCHAVLRIETARACGGAGRALDRELLVQAIRQSDLLLIHYADSLEMARALGECRTAARLGCG